MGFGFDLVTRVEDVNDAGDYYLVDIELARDAMMPKTVQKLRARGRAMIATGLVENVGNRSRDIARAIKNIDVGEIDRFTEIASESRNEVTVRVNKQ